MSELLRIDIDGGKYTLIQHERGGTEILRYGQPWLKNPVGANAFLSMAYELGELRRLNEVAKK